MNHPYYWLRFCHSREWVIFEQITPTRYYGWGSHWNAGYFDKITGPLLDPENHPQKEK